jgi:hypothetical protein
MNIPIQAIPKYKGKETSHSDMADNIDIRRAIFGAVPEANEQVKEFAKYFGRNNQRETCKAIFDFLKSKVKYVADGELQMIKLPSALLHSKVGDCKSYSLLTSAILTNLGIPHHFVLTSYNADPTPSHIYVETNDGCIIDAVWGIFDDEKQPTYRYEVKTNGKMKVKSISGMNNATYMGGYGCGCGCNSCRVTGVGATCNAGIGAAETARDWAIRNGIWYSFNNGERIVIQGKIVSPIHVVARGIIRTLIGSNAGGMATMLKTLDNESTGSPTTNPKFKQSSFDKKRDIEIKWLQEGGNPNELYDSMNKGAAKSPKGKKFADLILKASQGSTASVKDWISGLVSAVFGKKYVAGIGDPATTTAATTSAAVWIPIIKTLAAAIGTAIVASITQGVSPSDDESAAGSGTGSGTGTGTGTGSGSGSGSGAGAEDNTTTYLVIGAAAIAAFFLLNKKGSKA